MKSLQSLAAQARQLITLDFSQGVLWNIGSIVVLAVGGILANTAIVTTLGADALGIFNLVYGVYVVLSQIAIFGLHFSVLRQVSHYYNNPSVVSQTVFTALTLLVLINIPIIALTYLSANIIGDFFKSEDVAVGLSLAIPGLLFFSINKLLVNVLNGLNKMKAYAILRSIRFILIPIIILILVFGGAEAKTIPVAFTITEVLLTAVTIPYLLKTSLRWYPLTDFQNIAREHLSFGLRSMLSGIFVELSFRLDILVLGFFVDDTMVGVYSFAAVLAEGFSQLSFVIRWSVDPLVGQFFAQENHEKVISAIARIRRIFVPLMTVIGLTSIVGYAIVYRLFFPNDYPTMSSIIFAILVLGVIFNARYRPFVGFLLQSNHPGAYTSFMLTLVVIRLIISVILTNLWGVYGMTIATSLGFVIEGLLLKIFVKSYLNLNL